MDEQKDQNEQNESVSFEESLSEEQRNTIQEQMDRLGSLLHDEWRAPRKKEDGTYEPREKTTKDQVWIEVHGTDKVDIANTSYKDLPLDWQAENKASAEVAIREVWKADTEEKQLDDSFIESASSVIHNRWLERNGEWAPAEQKKPFEELSKEEQEKDRAIIRKAIEISTQQL